MSRGIRPAPGLRPDRARGAPCARGPSICRRRRARPGRTARRCRRPRTLLEALVWRGGQSEPAGRSGRRPRRSAEDGRTGRRRLVDGRAVRGCHPACRRAGSPAPASSPGTGCSGRRRLRSPRWWPTSARFGPVWWWCRLNPGELRARARPHRRRGRAVARDRRGRRARRPAACAVTPAPLAGWSELELELPDAAPVALDEAGPDDPALICFTSGTTGAPKGAVLRQRNLLAGAESVGIAWRWEPDDRLVHCLPLFHAHGLCVGVYGTLLAGGVGGAPARRSTPLAVVDVGRRRSGPRSSSVCRPCTTGWCARAWPAGSRGLRLCVSGSAPLARRTARRGQPRPSARWCSSVTA